MADRVRRVERRRQLIRSKRGVIDVSRGSGQAAGSERLLHLRRRVIEISCELDFLVADRRHLRDRAGEVLLEIGSDGVQLHADLRDRSRGPAPARERRCRHRAQERPPIHVQHAITPLSAHPATARASRIREKIDVGYCRPLSSSAVASESGGRLPAHAIPRSTIARTCGDAKVLKWCPSSDTNARYGRPPSSCP